MTNMKIQYKATIRAIALLFLGLFNGGCAFILGYPSIDVQVVDAKTGEPIEGAVLLAQWTTTTCVYECSSTNYKVVEKVSDENGRMTVPGVYKVGVDAPSVVVYKKGYVAWQHDFIFPDYKKRTDFRWRDGYVFELELFKPEYSHEGHVRFLRNSNSSPISGLLNEAFRWEALLKYK